MDFRICVVHDPFPRDPSHGWMVYCLDPVPGREEYFGMVATTLLTSFGETREGALAKLTGAIRERLQSIETRQGTVEVTTLSV